MAFFMHVILIFLCLNLTMCAVVTKYPLSDRHLKKYDSYDYVVPDITFVDDQNSSFQVSLIPNEYVRSSYENPVLGNQYSFLRGIVLAVYQKYMYIAGKSVAVLWIFDISSLNQPKYLLSPPTIRFENGIVKMEVHDDKLFVFVMGVGVFLYDLSTDPLSPQLVFSLEEIDVRDFEFENGLLYYIDSNDLYIMNITDLTSSTILSSISLYPGSSQMKELSVSGDYGYIVDNVFLTIVDMTNKSDPFYTPCAYDYSPGSRYIYDLSSNGHYAFLVWHEGLHIVNVTNKLNCEFLVDFNNGMSEYSSRIFVDSNRQTAYLSVYKGVRIYKYSSTLPGFASEVCFVETENVYEDRTVIGNVPGYENILFLTDYYKGFRIYNVSNTTNPMHLSSGSDDQSNIGWFTELDAPFHVVGRYLYFFHEKTNLLNGFKVFDVSSRLNGISFVGEYFTGSVNSISSHVVSESHAYICVSGVGIQIVDISNKQSPELLHLHDTVVCESLFVDKHFLYVKVGMSSTMYVYDISNKTSPVQVGILTVSMTSFLTMRFTQDDFGYVMEEMSIRVFNISDKSQIEETAVLTGFQEIKDVVVSHDFLFVLDENDRIKIVNLTDRARPQLLFDSIDIDLSSLLRMDVENDLIYYGGEYTGIHVLYVADPLNPIKLGTVVSGKFIFEAKNNLLYLSDIKYDPDPKISVYRMNMRIQSTEKFSSLCGGTRVSLAAYDYEHTVETSFLLSKDDYCNYRGTCLPDYRCVDCRDGYIGDYCSDWKCYSVDFHDVSQTCNGKGDCVAPDECKCWTGFVRKDCSYNIMYATVLAPSVSVASMIVLGVLLLILCLCCVICIMCCCCCVTIIFGLGVYIMKQSFRWRKLRKLKNVDILLQEQEAEDNTGIAHIRINKDLFEIPYGEIKIEKILGEGGSSSVVYLSTWKGRKVAFKCFKTRNICSTQDTFDEFEKEAEVFASISHPNIVSFFGCTMDPPRVGIVMEFCEKGEILNFIKIYNITNERRFPMKEKFRMMSEICSGMDYLHSRGITHRDLKCENVLLSGSEECKIMDFGLARISETLSQQKTKGIGTSIYMAPEIVTAGGRYNEKCDVFSFAIMIFMIVSENSHPYGDVAENSIEFQVAYSPTFRPDVSEMRRYLKPSEQWIINETKRCWDHDAEKRPSFEELHGTFDRKNYQENDISDDIGKENSSQQEEYEMKRVDIGGKGRRSFEVVFGKVEGGVVKVEKVKEWMRKVEEEMEEKERRIKELEERV